MADIGMERERSHLVYIAQEGEISTWGTGSRSSYVNTTTSLLHQPHLVHHSEVRQEGLARLYRSLHLGTRCQDVRIHPDSWWITMQDVEILVKFGVLLVMAIERPALVCT